MTYPIRPGSRVALLVLGAAIAGFALATANDRTAPANADRTPSAETSRKAAPAAPARGEPAKDIRLLSQHFNKPGNDLSPWRFIPDENVKELSTDEHPGLVTLWEAGKGSDIKGILADPIRIDDYPLPWQFQMGMIPSFNAQVGIGGKPQANYAIGLNVAVTFSDPATWPGERDQRPPDTHDLQLLVVHLGVTGEAGVGLPQFVRDPYPSGESYWVWGRGDLDHKSTGDWQVPYVWVGDGSKYGGPASQRLFFRCILESPTMLSVGIRFDDYHGWNTRRIDCSSFGKITGVWEIGPVISADRWIPDVLCKNLPVLKGAYPIFAGRVDGGKYREDYVQVNAPKPLPPDPYYEYYVDYCTFSHVMLNTGNNAPSLEHYSEDFNIPGYTGSYGLQEQSVRGDTFSNPGYFTLMLMGPDLGTGFGCGGFMIDFERYKPPFEIETCVSGPDDSAAWNWCLLLDIYGGDGKSCGRWFPGIANDPKKKRHAYFDLTKQHLIKIEFEREVPEEVLAHRPLHMLWQVLDDAHIRVGFKAGEDDAWHLSKVFDCSGLPGGRITKLFNNGFGSGTGRMWGGQPGAAAYQRFLIRYVHYRYGISVGKETDR